MLIGFIIGFCMAALIYSTSTYLQLKNIADSATTHQSIKLFKKWYRITLEGEPHE